MNTEDSGPNNLIKFKKAKRQNNLEPVRKGYDSCKHESIFVDDGTRAVTCQKCEATLDAFAVLLDLAWKKRRFLEELDAWDAYRESKLSERYDEEWEQTHGDVVIPPTDPETLAIWNTFRDYYGKKKFCAMYHRKARKRSGPEWYGKSTYGGVVSYEYARNSLIKMRPITTVAAV